MADYKLAEMELRFANLIWDNEPITSPELVRLSEEAMHWKKSTTYTILKRLCDRGLFKNENTVVSSIVSREEFFAGQSRRFIEDTFGGSLPRFLASFIGGKKLSDKQAEELVRLINEHKEPDEVSGGPKGCFREAKIQKEPDEVSGAPKGRFREAKIQKED